jgi:diguanylate cyclase (GGDEF)-like protein
LKRNFEVIETRQLDHLRIFHDVARALTASLEVDDVLQTIMEKMAQFFGPERWSLLMVDEKAGDLYYAVAIGQTSKSLHGLRLKMGEGIAGWVAESGTPLIVPDVNADEQWAAFAKSNPGLDIHSIACLPIRSGDKTLGVIQLLNSKLDLMSEYSLSFLRILCDYAAIAIQNARSMMRIQELSITDDCTGLFNARHLYTMLDEEMAQVKERGRRPFSLLFVDLDRFKSVNDTHGHLVGSRLLAEVGSLMKRCMGPGNASFRYGGDEFVAFLPGADKGRAEEIARRFWSELRATPFLTGAELALQVTGSFGLATFPEDGDTIKGIIRSADAMMYQAKAQGRDRIVVAGADAVAPAELGRGSRHAGTA